MSSLFALLVATAVLTPSARADTTITFIETTRTFTGWNSQTNEYLTSSDGVQELEYSYLNNPGHSHSSGGIELNHNYSSYATDMQGVRIRRVDGAVFKVIQMDLYGEAAVGSITSVTSGAGVFTLYTNSAGR